MRAESGLDIGRRVKAKRIAAALRGLGGTADDARKLNEVDWIRADMLSVQQTGHGGPKRGDRWQVPSAVTRALVIEYLSRDDQPRDEDIPPA